MERCERKAHIKNEEEKCVYGSFVANQRLLFPSWSLMLYETRRIAFYNSASLPPIVMYCCWKTLSMDV